MGGILFNQTVEDLSLGGGDRDDKDGATEAVDIVIAIPETVPHPGDGDGAETGIEVAFFQVGDEVAAGRGASVGQRLEAQDFVGRVFDADVSAMEFRYQVDHVAGAVERFDLPIPFGGDGAVEAKDADRVGGIGGGVVCRCGAW